MLRLSFGLAFCSVNFLMFDKVLLNYFCLAEQNKPICSYQLNVQLFAVQQLVFIPASRLPLPPVQCISNTGNAIG